MNNQYEKEAQRNLVCMKHKEKQITMIIMDNQIPFKDVLICSQCIEDNPTLSYERIEISEALKLINEKQNNQDFRLEGKNQLFSQELQSLTNKMLEYKNKVNQLTDLIINNLSQWMTNIKTSNNLDLVRELQQLYENNFQINKQENINQTYLIEVVNTMKKLIVQDELVTFHLQIKQLEQYLNEQFNIQPQKIIQINQIKQKEECNSIAFNKTGTLMITSSNEKIKVWEFNKGVCRELKILTGHTQSINCLVFSKQLNWFVSCACDQTIIGWKEEINDWLSTQPQQQHYFSVNCLILNKNENELISGGADKTIKVWKIDCLKNDIQYDYTFDFNHEGCILAISLNLDETTLVSCSNDGIIMLWMKSLNQKWKYINKLSSIQGYRICFINNTQFMFQPMIKNITMIFSIENQQMVEQQNLHIILNKADDDLFLFPTIYNQKKQLFIQKHNKYVYIIQRQIYGQLKIVLEPIDCQNWSNYGQLTEDGQYLVIWNNETKEFRVYQICYSNQESQKSGKLFKTIISQNIFKGMYYNQVILQNSLQQLVTLQNFIRSKNVILYGFMQNRIK